MAKSKGDVEREVRKKERLEKEIKDVKTALDKKTDETKVPSSSSLLLSSLELSDTQVYEP